MTEAEIARLIAALPAAFHPGLAPAERVDRLVRAWRAQAEQLATFAAERTGLEADRDVLAAALERLAASGEVSFDEALCDRLARLRAERNRVVAEAGRDLLAEKAVRLRGALVALAAAVRRGDASAALAEAEQVLAEANGALDAVRVLRG
jgi:hypothetical protein